jgi:catechol 2,3-dioxygenase-like lactoylglutathione lyase family enzyme
VIDAQRVDFIAVPTKEVQKAAEFYGQVLGLEENPNSLHDWIEFETGNVTLALVSAEGHGFEFAPLPPGSIALRVPDVAEARAKLIEAGVEIVGESWDSGVCHGVGFRDPDGNGLLLHHRYAAYPDGTRP